MATKVIEVDGGKYQFRIPAEDYRVQILRYQEPWVMIGDGCNAIAALMAEVERLREVHEAWREWAVKLCESHIGEGTERLWADHKLRASLGDLAATFSRQIREGFEVRVNGVEVAVGGACPVRIEARESKRVDSAKKSAPDHNDEWPDEPLPEDGE